MELDPKAIFEDRKAAARLAAANHQAAELGDEHLPDAATATQMTEETIRINRANPVELAAIEAKRIGQKAVTKTLDVVRRAA